MVLEGCAEPNLGCCILLRGASLPELVKVKKVVKFMLLACYNWKLEKAFLGDIEAILPEPGMTFEDDVNNENEVTKNSIEFSNHESQSIVNVTRNDSFNDDTRKSNETDSNESSRSDNIFTNSNVKDVKSDRTETTTSEPNNAKVITNEEPIKDESTEENPLHISKSYVRKTDSDKTLSCGVPIRDFSDPLRATISVDDDVFLPKEEAKLKADSHSDRWVIQDEGQLINFHKLVNIINVNMNQFVTHSRLNS